MFNDDTAVGRLTNYQKFKPKTQLRETLHGLQKKLRDQAHEKLLERSTEEALTQQFDKTYSVDQTGLDVDISKSIGTPSNHHPYNMDRSRNLRFEDPRATIAHTGMPYRPLGGPLNASVQLDMTNNWHDNLKRQLYTS